MIRLIRRIALVNPFAPINKEVQKRPANDTCYPPLGLLYLKEWVKVHFPKIDVVVFDCGIIPSEKLLYESLVDFSPDLVGISVLTPTYKSGLEIAEFTKNTFNSSVILGNDHACIFPELILNNRSYVDYVIHSDVGEVVFIQLLHAILQNKSPDNINSIAYRKGKKVIVNPAERYNLDSLYKPSTTIYPVPPNDFKTYVTNFNEKYERIYAHKFVPITINGVRGCSFNNKRCYYCSIYDLERNNTTIEYYWQMITELNENYGVNFFFEVCDNFTGYSDFLETVVEKKPEGLDDIVFNIYGRASNIVKNQEQLIPLFQKLNVKEINMGLDSGDPVTIRRLKFTNINDGEKEVEFNLEAVKVLSEAGIFVHASFISGALGENSRNLKNSVDFMVELLDLGNFSALEHSKLVPLPNSIYWDIFLGKIKASDLFPEISIDISQKKAGELREKYDKTDLIDLESVVEDWFKYFTSLSLEWTDKKIQEMDEIIESRGVISGVNIL